MRKHQLYAEYQYTQVDQRYVEGEYADLLYDEEKKGHTNFMMKAIMCMHYICIVAYGILREFTKHRLTIVK